MCKVDVAVCNVAEVIDTLLVKFELTKRKGL